MKHEYTDTQLQAAIDGACKEVANGPHRPMFAELALIDTEMHAWVNENDARLDLIKSALAALPEPEPPTVDGKTPGQVAWDAGNEVQKRKFPNEPVMSWQEGYELHEEHEAAASAVLAAFGKQSQSQSQPQLSQLRPLSEAGPVPEGCVRVRAWEDINRWIYGREEWDGDTHFADIQLPAAKADEPAKSETFEDHGRTWTKHTPGDPMPCDGSSAVMALLGDGTFCTQQAEDWNWNNRNSKFDIVGWCYADEPTPEPLVTKPISPPTWTPEIGDVVTLKSGGAKMTVVKLADTEGGLLAFLCEWFSDSGEYDSGVIYLTSLQPA